MNRKISIIVPIYNTEKYLKKCLDSILKQSLKEIEVIAVNDGSLDNSLKILREYEKKDSRIIVIDKENGGLSSARNAGLEISSGEYILHIDSDDWIEQEYLKDMYDKAKKNNLDIVVSDIIWDFDNGKVEYKQDLPILENEEITGKKYLSLLYNGKIFPAVWNKLYKTKLYKDYKISHPVGISLGEDLATTPLLAAKAERIGKINKAYVHYIQNFESITKANPTKKIYELIKCFEILEENMDYIDLEKMNKLKVENLGGIIYYPNYDLNDFFYKKAFEYYVNLFKDLSEIESTSKKRKCYYKLLKMKPNIRTLKFICYFDRFVIKIKKKLRKFNGK